MLYLYCWDCWWLCWRNSVNSSVNQIWNRMMFTLLRHSQWTEMTFQIEGWYVTGLDIVKWQGRWEKHAFVKLCIITTSPGIEHLAGVFVAARTARHQHPLTRSRLIHFMFHKNTRAVALSVFLSSFFTLRLVSNI